MNADGKKKPLDEKAALEKARAWCAYQERCQQETRDKLYEWGLWPAAVESIIALLISENFLNEERFAKAYVGGKFRIKKWGRQKIRMELKKRRISDYCIKSGLNEINGEEYIKILHQLLDKKIRSLKSGTVLSRNYKAAGFAIAKGYEPDLVWDALKDLSGKFSDEKKALKGKSPRSSDFFPQW